MSSRLIPVPTLTAVEKYLEDNSIPLMPSPIIEMDTTPYVHSDGYDPIDSRQAFRLQTMRIEPMILFTTDPSKRFAHRAKANQTHVYSVTMPAWQRVFVYPHPLHTKIRVARIIHPSCVFHQAPRGSD